MNNAVYVSNDDVANQQLDIEGHALWQAWPGNNRPICGGRMLCGPDQGVIACNLGLVIVLSTLFCVFVGARLHPLVVVGTVLLVLLTLYSLAKATWTEAGIIPRLAFQRLQRDYDRLPLLPENVRVAVTPAQAQAQAQAPHSQAQRLQSQAPTELRVPSGPEVETAPYEVDANGQRQVLKWCNTCRIYRPARAKHCRDCDNCCEEFDHHCPWVCNCIGKRNYRYFVAFVLSVTMLASYVCTCSVILVGKAAAASNFSQGIAEQPFAAVLTLFTFMVGWCLCSLSWYHVWLIGQDMTTNEHIKMQRAELGPAAGGGGAAPARSDRSASNSRNSRSRRIPSTEEQQGALRSVAVGGDSDPDSSSQSSESGDGSDREGNRRNRGCLGRIWNFFARPDVPSYFSLRAPLGRSVFVRTMVPVGDAAVAAARAGRLPVAYPVYAAGQPGAPHQGAQGQAAHVPAADEDFDLHNSPEHSSALAAEEQSRSGGPAHPSATAADNQHAGRAHDDLQDEPIQYEYTGAEEHEPIVGTTAQYVVSPSRQEL